MVSGRHRNSAMSRRRQRRLERRGRGRRKRYAVAPWIVASLVTVLLLSGVSFGYVWLSRAGCSGPQQTASVVASPDQYAVMSDLAQKWQQTEPSVGGTCVGVTVQRKDPSEVAAALSPSWDERRDGPQPDVWAPDSSGWLLVASNRPEAAAMLPADPPSVASSAVVIAMPRPVAEALGWPGKQIGWLDLVGAFATGKTWAQFGHPEWGRLKLSMTDPTRSTAGLNALVTITDANGNESVSDNELKASLVFSRLISDYRPDTDQVFAQLTKADQAGNAIGYTNAFPALERDVSVYNDGNPKTPLVAAYPKEGTVYADYPYALLHAPWVTELKEKIAGEFLGYLRGENARKAYGVAGFRDADQSRKDSPGLTAQRGFAADSQSLPRELATGASVTRTVVQWTALQRRSTVLAVLDTSGSMADIDPATKKTRMQIVQEASVKANALWNEQSSVGLWQFSSGLTPTTPYQQLVPLGPVSGKVGGVPRRQALAAAIARLQPKGNTSLYDTVWAAYQEVQANWKPNQLNLVAILTDGKDDNDSGLKLAELIGKLQRAQRPDQPVQILTVAYTPTADVQALQEISRTTGGRTFVSRNPDDIERVFIAALFGR